MLKLDIFRLNKNLEKKEEERIKERENNNIKEEEEEDEVLTQSYLSSEIINDESKLTIKDIEIIYEEEKVEMELETEDDKEEDEDVEDSEEVESCPSPNYDFHLPDSPVSNFSYFLEKKEEEEEEDK